MENKHPPFQLASNIVSREVVARGKGIGQRLFAVFRRRSVSLEDGNVFDPHSPIRRALQA
jgi:hypothetical protein